jgi:hypothetical protein
LKKGFGDSDDTSWVGAGPSSTTNSAQSTGDDIVGVLADVVAGVLADADADAGVLADADVGVLTDVDAGTDAAAAILA